MCETLDVSENGVQNLSQLLLFYERHSCVPGTQFPVKAIVTHQKNEVTRVVSPCITCIFSICSDDGRFQCLFSLLPGSMGSMTQVPGSEGRNTSQSPTAWCCGCLARRGIWVQGNPREPSIIIYHHFGGISWWYFLMIFRGMQRDVRGFKGSQRNFHPLDGMKKTSWMCEFTVIFHWERGLTGQNIPGKE